MVWCGEPEPNLIPLTVKPVHLHIKGIINTLQTAKHIMPGSESHNTHSTTGTHTHKPTRTRWVHKNPVSGLKDEPTTTAMRYWRAPFARAPQASNLHAFRLVATLHSSYLIARRQELVSLEPRLFLSRSWKPHRDPQFGTTSWWRADEFTATRCEIMSLALVLIGSSCSAC